MKEGFINKKFGASAIELIDRMNSIMDDYEGQGYNLSLRQLYYQLVSKNVVPNTEESYKRVGNILSDARLAGMVDWEMIVDRGRETTSNQHWDSASQILDACARSFRYDLRSNQPWHIEVMVEKQALEGVLEPVCKRLDVAFSANKGYGSSSFFYEIGKRLEPILDNGRNVCVIYLGDHDPSGIDMTRDVSERLKMFSGYCEWDEDDKEFGKSGRYDENQVFAVERLALNMDQVEYYGPPPNPAKLTDSRATEYIKKFGLTSWELDALEPSVLDDLVTDMVNRYTDGNLWDAAISRQSVTRSKLHDLALTFKE